MEDNRIINDFEESLDSYVCEECGQTSYVDCGEDIKQCSYCGASKKHLAKNMTLEDFEEEEYEYHCENCFEYFTSTLTENIKCPNCGYVHESLDPIDHEDRELDLQINDEDWEDL